MSPRHYKCIVIGGGSAGYAAANAAHKYHNSVAIVDNAKELGGLCILRGCMPSKTLIYSAEILHLAQKGHLFGLNIPEAKANMEAIQERKKRIISEFSDYRKDQLESDKFTLFRETGHFINENTLELESGLQLKGDKFIIATGSIINTPDIPGLKDVPFLTSDDVLNLRTLPESCIVLGAGPVGCELGQCLARMGSKITQIQRSPHILSHVSPQAAKVIENTFQDEGIDLFTKTHITQISHENNLFIVHFQYEGKNYTRHSPCLINALGRKPNIPASLQLDKTDVTLSLEGTIATNECLQSTNLNIYAAGDCTGHFEIVHMAILQGEFAAKHAFAPTPPPCINANHLVHVTFTDPQVAAAGLSESELQKQGIDYISATYPFDDHGRSILMEAKRGFVKVLASPSDGKILGAECISKDGGELIHVMSVAISLEATASDLLKTHWYHPTLSEIWTYPLEDIYEQI